MVSAMGWCDFEWIESAQPIEAIKVERVVAFKQGQVISSSENRDESAYKDYWASKQE
jgi:hypothetical protein